MGLTKDIYQLFAYPVTHGEKAASISKFSHKLGEFVNAQGGAKQGNYIDIKDANDLAGMSNAYTHAINSILPEVIAQKSLPDHEAKKINDGLFFSFNYSAMFCRNPNLNEVKEFVSKLLDIVGDNINEFSAQKLVGFIASANREKYHLSTKFVKSLQPALQQKFIDMRGGDAKDEDMLSSHQAAHIMQNLKIMGHDTDIKLMEEIILHADEHMQNPESPEQNYTPRQAISFMNGYASQPEKSFENILPDLVNKWAATVEPALGSLNYMDVNNVFAINSNMTGMKVGVTSEKAANDGCNISLTFIAKYIDNFFKCFNDHAEFRLNKLSGQHSDRDVKNIGTMIDDLTYMVRNLGRIGYKATGHFVTQLQQAAEPLLEHFTPRQLTRFSGVFNDTGHKMDRRFRFAWENECVIKINNFAQPEKDFHAPELASVLLSVSNRDDQIGDKWLREVCSRTASQLYENKFNPKELSDVMKAFSNMKLTPPKTLMENWCAATSMRNNQFEHRDRMSALNAVVGISKNAIKAAVTNPQNRDLQNELSGFTYLAKMVVQDIIHNLTEISPVDHKTLKEAFAIYDIKHLNVDIIQKRLNNSNVQKVNFKDGAVDKSEDQTRFIR